MTAFVFDFGAVLFHWQPVPLLRRVLPGLAHDEASARHWVGRVFQGFGGDWGEFDRGLIGRAEVVQRIAARTGLAEPQVAAVVDAVLVDLTPMPASEALVRRLQAAGQPLYFLSNMPAPFADHLERQYPVLSAFQAGVFSSRVRLSKPDPAIFALAARRFGQAPGELVLLDDSPANVAAAQAAGWRALLFADALQAEAELRAAGWWPAAAP